MPVTPDGFDLNPAQYEAWVQQFELLSEANQYWQAELPESRDWHLLLEYAIPRREQRPDAVLLAHDVILVLEFKMGATAFDEAARWQATSYALDLADFHLESRGRTIIPVLVATQARNAVNQIGSCASVWPVQRHNANSLASGILDCYRTAHRETSTRIDAGDWNDSPYRPSLTIIEAAEELYRKNTVREISHNYADNLSTTTDRLIAAIRKSQDTGTRTICFVTGVPGAGKTLAGLNAVHDPSVRTDERPAGVFLSGNGPLVTVIRAALAADCRTADVPKRESERRIKTFVQNVHQFLREYDEDETKCPPEHVVVFDEAQRAWNADQCRKKDRGEDSEPATLLNVMARAPNWTTVVALVGGGQEIHTGETGLAEWGRALAAQNEPWHVYVSPEALDGGPSLAGSKVKSPST